MRISDWSSDVCSSDLHLPAGDYRCRTIKVGARTGTLGYIAYSWFRCRVDAGQGAASLTKLTGSQRPVGRIFPDNAKRQIFLGTLELGDEKLPLDYGSEIGRASCRERVCQYV